MMMQVVDEKVTTGQGDAVPKLLAMAMTEGLRLLEDVHLTEARVSRLETELAQAQEHLTVAAERYDRNRKLAFDMWETLKADVLGEARERGAADALERAVTG